MMAEVPPNFSHAVKIEQTAKGARVTVHVYSNNSNEAMMQAIGLYDETIKNLQKGSHIVAPIEAK